MQSRNVTCFPGRVLVNKTCIPFIQTTSNLRYILATSVQGTLVDIVDPLLILDTIKSSIIEEVGTNSTSIGLFAISFESQIISINRSCNIFDAVKDTYNGPHEIFIYLSFTILSETVRIETEKTLLNITNRSFFVQNSDNSTTELISSPNPKAYFLPSIENKIHHLGHCYLSRQNALSVTASSIRPVFVSNLLECRQIELETDEFEVDETGMTLFFNYTHATLQADRFFVTDERSARICVDTFYELMTVSSTTHYPSTTPMSAEDSAVMKSLHIITMICISISLVCLLLTLAAYVAVPSMRSVPGINIMCLVISMIFALGIFQFGFNATSNPHVCIAIGVISHFFWLSTFGCMNVCSFHMYTMFVGTLSRQEHSSMVKKIIAYIAYSFGSSALIVTITIVTFKSIPPGDYIGYGGRVCFLSHPSGIIYAFILPVVIICVSNIYFFVRTFLAIRQAPKVQSTKERSNDFSILVKLFTLTGITWLFLILDAIQELSFFSFLVTILVCCQGLFIFISFVCNKRVLNLLKKRFGFQVQGPQKTVSYDSRQNNSCHSIATRTINSDTTSTLCSNNGDTKKLAKPNSVKITLNDSTSAINDSTIALNDSSTA